VNPGALAYDAIAAGYDAQLQGDYWMRRVLHAHYARLFRPGDRVLDVGCGTGIDALFLAQRGIHVVAIDFSASMLAELQAKLLSAPVAERVQARRLAVEDLGQLRNECFDGLISAFAGLSALDDLSQFGSDAAELVKPGGRLVLHLLNRFSLWEWLGYLSHADWPSARQVGKLRTREFSIGGRAVRHRVYYAEELYQTAFAERFVLRDAYALGSLRPPHTVHRLPPALVHVLERLDVRCGRWPLLRHAGRFLVLDLERLAA
jgi:SAM-dependent methyltransferase